MLVYSQEGRRCMIQEKERLINRFFKIGGNEKVGDLQRCKLDCERFLLKWSDDPEINDLVNVIEALSLFFQTGDRKEARKWVVDIWDKLYSKPNLSLFEIRILNCILFAELKVEKVVEAVDNCLIQLDIYKFHDDYVRTKIALNMNLLDLLIDAKFFDSCYDNTLDELISDTIQIIIRLNLENKLHNRYYVGLATMYQGILLKDDIKIYTGLLDLQSSSQNHSYSIQQLIKIYIEKYNISKSQQTSLLIQTLNQKYDV